MRGQAIRCPNHLCRSIFTVGGDQPPPQSKPPSPRPSRPSAKLNLSGSVGDLVPILPAERAQAVPPHQPPPGAPVKSDVPDLLPLVEAVPITAEKPELLEVVEPEVVEEAPLVLEPVEEAPKRKQPSKKPSPPQQPRPTNPPQAEPTPWRQATPPVRRTPAPEPAAVPAEPPVPTLEGPQELPAGSWETAAPPVRHADDADQALPVPEMPGGLPQPALNDSYPLAPAKKKRNLFVLVGVLVVGLAVFGTLGLFGWHYFSQTEAELFAESLQEYDQGKFSVAASHFKELQTKFPLSDRKDEYAFLEKLSDLRGHLSNSQLAADQGLNDLEKFVTDNKDHAQFKPRGRDLAKSAAKLLADCASSVPMGSATPDVLQRISKLRKNLVDQLEENGFTNEELASVEQALDRARGNLTRWQEEDFVLAQLRPLPLWKSPEDVNFRELPPAEAIEVANHLMRLHKMEQHSEARTVMERLYDGHAKSVRYERANAELTTEEAPKDFTTVLTVPAVKPAVVHEEDGIVLAVARGVLYALRRSDGQLKWWRRVGIDTTSLPVRVPAKPPNPELFLVVSFDSKTLTALNENGKAVWEYKLGTPSRGRPLIVERALDRLAYVPTYDGHIDVIELAKGQLLGRYDLKQRLSTGGVRQPGTDLLYFPADNDCIYVINAKEERLERILYTGHDAESLRGEPMIVAPDSAALARGEGYLLLNQTDGLHAMRLRMFALPLTDRFGPEAAINPAPRVPGWTWFPPSYDGEKVVLLTDDGVLGLFGVQQPGTKDNLLYPRLGAGRISLDKFLTPSITTQVQAQVVQVQGNDFWVLAHGKLQHLQIAWNAATGPRPVAAWPKPITLGSPLHASQVVTDRQADRTWTTLFLVTQSLTEPSCLATAVNDETGDVLWQRQLGLVCRTTPLALRLAADTTEPVLLVMDQSGGLFAFDPDRRQANLGEHGVRVADAVEDNPDMQPLILPAGDGQSAYQIACPGNGKTLLVRHVKLDKDHQVQVLADSRLDLRTAPLHGTPALVGNLLVLPLADGSLARLALPVTDKSLVVGDDYYWRSEQAPPDSRGHVLPLKPDRFLVTNGAHSFKVWQKNTKTQSGGWITIPDETQNLELENRVASPPVLVPANKESGTAEFCVADAAGTVWLLTVQADGQIGAERKWDLGGKVTAGPFLRTIGNEPRIGCVVDQRRLVWIDPNAADIIWTYDTKGKPIQGQPELVGGLLMVTDQAGQFTGLDPATGKADGPGYALRGSIAPSSTPVGFTPTRLFVPLTDGTIILLPMEYFRKPEP
jgi:hypothetical protein